MSRIVDDLGYQEIYAGDGGGGLKDMEGVAVPSSTTFDAAKQEQVMAGEIWLETEQDNLLDVDDASIFYNDFPPLPDFPCMSSSSSSSSAPASAKPVAARSSSSSASSSSSSAVSWTVMKPQAEGEKKRRHYTQGDDQTDAPSAAAALLSTASMEVLAPPEDGSEDVDCINVMENFGYMDLLDNNDIWDPSSIFQVENPQDTQEQKPMLRDDLQQDQRQQPQEGNDQLYFLQGNSELAVIFLEWLKQNREYISAEDMRSIKLKRSTIECASKRLGSTKEGKKQLLKLILEWVEQYQLHRKRMKEPAPDSPYHYQEPVQTTNLNPNSNSDLNCDSLPQDPNACFSPSPWMPAPPPYAPESAALVVPPAVFQPAMGFLCDPYSNGPPAAPGPNQIINGNLYPPPPEYQPMDSPQPWNAQPPFAVASQCSPFSDNTGMPVAASNAQALYGNPYPYQVFDGNSERLVRWGSSATKEARKKRMARQRRLSMHQYRHNNHQNQNESGDQHHARSSGDNFNSSQANRNGWVYWSPTAAPSSSTVPLVSPADASHSHTHPAERSHMQQQNHQRQASSDRRHQGYKTEKNLKFLLQKVLKQSDVGNLGRIVLPKKEAETHLPELESRDGIPIAMEDIGTSNVWNMRYRFWPNNKSRMYLLENTGDFVRVNGLQEGDFIVIYSDTKSGKYLIRGVKVRQPGSKAEGKKAARRNLRNLSQAGASCFSQLAPFKQAVK